MNRGGKSTPKFSPWDFIKQEQCPRLFQVILSWAFCIVFAVLI
uniref:Uncharacterized protein n=1 Tax=Rhizophora mucronata TaxID=61149 RepID=A0A2P2QJX1_RHIMU